MASQLKGKARSEGKGKKTVFLAGVELLDDARIAAYEKYRETDAYQGMDDKMRVLMVAFLAALATIWGLFLWLDSVLIPGARFVPIALVLYGAGSILRLWIICNWMVWRSSIKGLEFMPRGGLRISKKDEVDKLKRTLKIDRSGPRKKILCCPGNGGGGHDATLQGLRELLAELEYNADLVDVPMTWMVETHQHNPLYSLFGITGEQIYNWGLLQGPQSAWTITFCTSWAQYIALTLDGIAGWFGDRIGRDYGDETGKTCEKLWRAYKPDLILNFTTGTHGFMFSGLRRADMNIPIMSCVSDFEGRGVHGWIEDPRQYVLCGTSLCRQQAHDFGVPHKQVYQTSGMILRPDFYENATTDVSRHDSLIEYGLDPSVRTALVFWGGVGSSKVVEVGEAIAKSKHKLNFIFLCGRNHELAQKLQGMTWPGKVLIQGFTNKVSHFMQLADFCVCKPGPGVASEAALLGLPMIVEWSAFTLPQEVAVSRWIITRGLGLGFARTGQVTDRVDRMCELLGGNNETFISQIKYLSPKPLGGEGLSGVDLHPAYNKAIFEVPEVLHKVMGTHNYDEDIWGTGSCNKDE